MPFPCILAQGQQEYCNFVSDIARAVVEHNGLVHISTSTRKCIKLFELKDLETRVDITRL